MAELATEAAREHLAEVQAPASQTPARTFGHAFKRAMTVVRRLRGRDTHRPGELRYAQYGLLFGVAEHGPL